MEMQIRNGGDDYRNQQLDRSLLMESPPLPPPSKLFSDDSSPSVNHPLSATSSGGGSSVGDGGLGYIEHTVTKFDTLAGVAIKYGVEVADIKKMNGLTTDLQMFSRKKIHIPLPGRHPPSPIMSNGYDTHGPKRSNMTPPNHRHSDLFDSIKSLKLSSSSPRIVSPSMDALREYYGLKPTNQHGINDGFGPRAVSLEHRPKQPETSNPPHGLHRKCKSLACELSETGVKNDEDETPITNGKKPDYDTWYDKFMRRHRSEIDLQNSTQETMLKPDSTNTTTAFSPAAGKGLALRPKATSRTASDADGPQNIPPLKLGDSVTTDTFSGVKKSSSSPSFQESFTSSNNGTSTSSIWPTSMLNLTADLQALSTAAITRPMFDGLPKPMSGRKNKAAID